MKKKYIIPKMKEENMETFQMLAASLPLGEPGSADDAEGRWNDSDFDWEED